MASVSEQPFRAEPAVTPAQRWPANPAPLGLAGFGITTLVLSLINANLISGADTPVVLGMALAYGGIAQFIAGMWEFRAGNVFGAAAFSTYGAFWISFFILVSFDAAKIPAAHAGTAIGAYLWAWGLITAIFFLCTFRAPRALSLLFLLLTATYVLLAIGSDGPSTTVTHIGGYVGIATAVNALYLVLAFVMEGVYERPILPIGAPSPAPRGG
jgi:succinate-acetate transporter protein